MSTTSIHAGGLAWTRDPVDSADPSWTRFCTRLPDDSVLRVFAWSSDGVHAEWSRSRVWPDGSRGDYGMTDEPVHARRALREFAELVANDPGIARDTPART